MPESMKSPLGREAAEEKTERRVTIYGKERFQPEDARTVTEGLVSDFRGYCARLGYHEVPSVPITSGVDPTVRFIGSHISVFKAHFDQLPAPGIFMRQDCIRTRNADRLLDDTFTPAWGSYFVSIGAFSAPERLDEACSETCGFFERTLGIAPEHLLVRAASADKDLVDACRQGFEGIEMEMDSRPPEYYRHKIGMEGVWGRNVNVALKNPYSEGYSDVGNIIVIERREGRIGVEIALGTSTILKQIHGLSHVQDCAPVIGLPTKDEGMRRKFEDAIVTSVALFREGLRPFGQNNRNRILKQYVRALCYFRAKSAMGTDSLRAVIGNFEQRQFPEPGTEHADVLVEFIRAFENELLSKKVLTEDEQKMKTAILASS